nr:hypothetical protein [Tanacetum cinerariifolium]
KGECEVLKEWEKVIDKEYEELRGNCQAVMVDFDNDLDVTILHENIAALFGEVKEQKDSL